MKNLYETLGIRQDATAQDIKKAYRKLALETHPDKGGDSERMALLSEAYQTLSDADKRRHFDANWQAYHAEDLNEVAETTIDGYLNAGNLTPYSHLFKMQHDTLVEQYKQTPLMKCNRQIPIQPFDSSIYSIEEKNKPIKHYHDIFSFIHAKTMQLGSRRSSKVPVESSLSPKIAMELFCGFLAGNYYGTELTTLKHFFTQQMDSLKSTNAQASELILYEGIIEIIAMTDKTSTIVYLASIIWPRKERSWIDLGFQIFSLMMLIKLMLSFEQSYKVPDNQHQLMLSINKITQYAKNAPDAILTQIIPLFYNKFFRNLYAYALHIQWTIQEELFDTTCFNQLDGYQEAKDLLDTLKERLSTGNHNQNLIDLIQYVRLLYSFEKDCHESRTKEPSAEFYRKHAYHYLDWIPVFIEQSSRHIIVNIFLQIGMKFQQASMLELDLALKMADERLALKMYLTAAEIGHHSTPDVAIYANTHALKYTSAFEFEDTLLHDVIPALKKRTLNLTDVFPFFENHQSNIARLRQGNNTLHLMRKLLNALIHAYEYNKLHSKGISVDHSAVTILYQAYEACIKNWYQEEFDPAVEQQFRVDLMEELLFDNGWTFLDVEQQLDSPWIMVDRDKDGWMNPTRSLPYTYDVRFDKFSSINGAEVNHKTGEIHFFMTKWTANRPVHEKLFSLFDLQEMLEKNISAAIFSLDPVDPYKPFHPYNLMRFAPSQLCDSEMLNTMLLTDYILKFLTTHQEVQGQHPFNQRSVETMIQHLPQYLRQIVDEFHQSKHSGAIHRFWIEAEEIDISLSDESKTQHDLTRVSLGSLKMVVKKHRMERDIHGELKDVDDEDEGWPIYVFTNQELRELTQGIRLINSHAMIFIYAEKRVIFWENNEIIKTHVPENYHETLIRLFKQPKDLNGHVIQNTKNRPLIYRVIQDITQQAGLSHRYSPEFIFAHKFTTHYDEFAQYLPEFGRLKELSRMSSLIRVLDGIRRSNQECTQALDYILNPPLEQPAPTTDAYARYHQAHEKMKQKITDIFKDWTSTLIIGKLEFKWCEQLNKMKRDIGTLNFSQYSNEVNDECERQVNYNHRNSRGYSRYEIEKMINKKRAEIANQLSISKKAAVRTQITELFSTHLSALSSVASGQLIDAFMDGNIKPLAQELAKHEKIKAHEDIQKQFPGSTMSDIILGLDHLNPEALSRIATAESHRQLREQKQEKETLETGFVNIHLGQHEEPVDLEGRCFWVPASVRHDVKKDAISGLTRYSLFVYGGVSVQPRINMVSGGNASLGGNRVGGGAFNRKEITQGFQSHHIVSPTNLATKNHELLSLAGFNNKRDINSRVNRIFLPVNREQHPSTAERPGRSLHNGRHTQVAMDSVANKMDQIVRTGQAQNWNPTQYRSAFRAMVSECRQELRTGQANLYAKNMLSNKSK